MKIKKRQQPVDLQSLDEEGAPTPAFVDAAEAAQADQAFAFAPPPSGDLAVEAKSATPAGTASGLTPRIPVTRTTSVAPSSGWTIYMAALVVSVLWACAPIAFAWGYRRSVAPFDFEPFAVAVFAALAIGPAALVWALAYMVRQGQLLGAEARRTKALADEMVTPAMAAGAQTVDLVHAMREEIARAGAAAQEARDTIIVLRQALAGESEELAAAAANAARTAQGLSQTLGRERSELGGLAQTLDSQATAVADAITRQAKMVGEASDLAEAQLREAEASLAARAADLAAAAGETSDAARAAAEDLTRHIARLETAGLGVTEQIGAVEKGLTEQRAGLVTAAHALRADHEGFAAQAETHTAQLAEFIGQARLSAAEMGDRAVKGGEALRQLMAQATAQFRELAETAKAERDEFGQSTLHSVEAVAQAAATERARLEEQTRAAITAMTQAAEDTRQVAARHAETARDQVDQLSEAAFTAGQQANKVFEARLDEARALIEQSSQMVEQAGAATVRKLDEGARAARATLDELTAMLGDIEERATKLPAAARDRAEEVRMAVAESIDELMDHARRTADETQAIDEAFQDRVRRNYDMLSEAVRLMGSVATSAGAVAPAPVRERPERVSLRASLAAKSPAPVIEPERAVEPEPEPADETGELELNEPLSAEEVGDRGRPRLRLTPTATDAEFSHVFEQAGGRHEEPAAADGWTWKDLLSSLEEHDEGAAEAEAEAASRPLEDILAGEIGAMGIDPTALLPRSRIHELAVALQVRDVDGARAVVRKLAPAATRRLTRKLFTDEPLKRQVMTYLARYNELLEDAAERDAEGFVVETLLSSEAGRTYLLFDAAAGDLA
ncbi:MAG: polar localization protein TipN [Phenylobacterium sp.]|uniref:polar localization protein TipN n=1 Tax=Phenylobacterium sp. TaxID=1871053 RepID=UPI0025EC60D1|nr:polar localization protein TipN [Phenylobacterium sp.]MBA4014014.1 polar localization protein TipN [Phenylobacterium sp.]